MTGRRKKGEKEKEKRKRKRNWILCFFICMCLAVVAVLAIVSVLLNRDIRDSDDDGAIKLPIEQSASDFLEQFLGNSQQTNDFIRCMSGCGAGAATPCNTTTDCIDPEECRPFCGGRFHGSLTPGADSCPPPGGCPRDQICELICARITVLASCPLDCLCATSDDPPGFCGPVFTMA
ncbi:hypothetical protein LCGC14_0888280 [marine sediment metagenome]|uniref:Uncharacterized protein n=1 Tax=marine sediment metagenome TaxID=412755 RepID=A0A0F9RJ98_9ZZZZ